jgi:hypothetical protein
MEKIQNLSFCLLFLLCTFMNISILILQAQVRGISLAVKEGEPTISPLSLMPYTCVLVAVGKLMLV